MGTIGTKDNLYTPEKIDAFWESYGKGIEHIFYTVIKSNNARN